MGGELLQSTSKEQEKSGWKECGEKRAAGERDQVQPTPVQRVNRLQSVQNGFYSPHAARHYPPPVSQIVVSQISHVFFTL